jgi:hypothetical protein
MTTSVTSGLISVFDSTNVNGGYIVLRKSNVDNLYIGNRAAVSGDGGTGYDFYSTSGLDLRFFAGATKALTRATTGAATFSSSVTAGNNFVAKGTLQGYSGAGIFMSYESYGGRLESYDYSTSSWKNIAIAPNGGNVGIGTSSPSQKLHVTGSGNVVSLVETAAGAFAQYQLLGSPGGTPWIFGHQSDYLSGSLVFRNVSDRMVITTGGNVGIGVVPDTWRADIGNVRALQFDGGSIWPFRTSGTGEINIAQNYYYGASGTRFRLQTGEATNYRQGDGAHIWQYAASGAAGSSFNFTEAMRITSGGVFKATTDGTYDAISGTANEFNQSVPDWVLVLRNKHATSPFGMFVNYTGASPNNTDSEFLYCRDGGLTLRAAIRSNGGLANYQANNVNLSDERTKKDIIPLESYWDKFKAIEIVKFKYKDQTHDDFNIGVIAQQVEKVAPEFVDVDGWSKPKLDEDGNEIISEDEPLKSIYTADLHHATIKVLQECMSKIEEQQAQIEELKELIKNK